jgi:hypothetical protein
MKFSQEESNGYLFALMRQVDAPIEGIRIYSDRLTVNEKSFQALREALILLENASIKISEARAWNKE